MTIEPIVISGRRLRVHKSVHQAKFDVRTVLTNDPFNYVDLWLRREEKEDALFYWRQARAFYQASQNLPLESSPLVLYYCFMNAAKALLSAKGVPFIEHHGLKAQRMRGPRSRVVLSNEGIKLLNAGIAPAISGYLSEVEARKSHSLEDVLYNIVCVHRTFVLSFPRSSEMFLPLREAAFVRDSETGKVYLRGLAVGDVNWLSARRILPSEFRSLPDGSPGVISRSTVAFSSSTRASQPEMESLQELNRIIRSDIHYIAGAQTLWYLKLRRPHVIARRPMTLILAAMHRLSEICRYRPSELQSFLDGRHNWLLSEFVAMAPSQYLDEIACEMTGHQIMVPNVRAPV